MKFRDYLAESSHHLPQAQKFIDAISRFEEAGIMLDWLEEAGVLPTDLMSAARQSFNNRDREPLATLLRNKIQQTTKDDEMRMWVYPANSGFEARITYQGIWDEQTQYLNMEFRTHNKLLHFQMTDGRHGTGGSVGYANHFYDFEYPQRTWANSRSFQQIGEENMVSWGICLALLCFIAEAHQVNDPDAYDWRRRPFQ